MWITWYSSENHAISLTKLFSFLILQTPDFYVEMKWEFTSWGKKLNNMFIYYIAKEKVTIYMYMYWLI